jgi:hypothetical protein
MTPQLKLYEMVADELLRNKKYEDAFVTYAKCYRFLDNVEDTQRIFLKQVKSISGAHNRIS